MTYFLSALMALLITTGMLYYFGDEVSTGEYVILALIIFWMLKNEMDKDE